MSRGRRGGRRQRRREEQARQGQPASAKQSNGQSGPASVVLPAAAPEPEHPRPMSARELVARMEKLHAQEHAAHGLEGEHEPTPDATPVHATPHDALAAERVEVPREPRRFRARDSEWIATHVGRGVGGSGRVAHARIEAIRFANAADPDAAVAEALAPHARLDDLYDDELAALLEQALRYRKEDG